MGMSEDFTTPPYEGTDSEGSVVNDTDQLSTKLDRINKRLDAIEAATIAIKMAQNAQRDGINTIGEMMNSVASAFDQIMQKVNQGGIGALLGGMMGGKNNG